MASSITQKQAAGIEKDTAGAMRAASERISRDQSQTRELQEVAELIIELCGGIRGIDQMAALKTLAAVKLKDDTNLTNLNASLRDAGWMAIRDFLSKVTPSEDKPLSDAAADEYVQRKYLAGLLRNAMAISADEADLERVRKAMKKAKG